MVLGGGPNRIGQGIEFDYCCVHAALALREDGFETIMVNCNPETVSTDYDTSDRLYFEPLTLEDVLEIVALEKPVGVIVQFGGQTPLKLARDLEANGVPIIGTSPDSIDIAEDRERFQKLLHKLKLKQPPNRTARSEAKALSAAAEIGYPLVVRPSYVLGGRAMEIVHEQSELERYMREAIKVSNDSPVLLDRFLNDAIEVDVDAISDGTEVIIGGVMEHIEQAGVHSGDSACSLPPFSLSPELQAELRRQTVAMAKALKVNGLMNVQFAIQNGPEGDVVYVLEVNPRASRTVPFVSKATGLPLAKIAARCMSGRSLADQRVTREIVPPYYSVKEAVFPFIKFPGADTILGPEMKSTGEVMGVGETFAEAFVKSQLGSGERLPKSGKVFVSLRDADKERVLDIARVLTGMGFTLVATHGTAKALEAGLIDGFWANGMGSEVAILNGVGSLLLDARRGDGPAGSVDYTFPAFVTTQRKVEEKPAEAQAAMRAIVNAQQALKRDPSLAVKAVKNHFPPAETALIAELIRRDAPFFDAAISRQKLDALNDFSRSMGILSGPKAYGDVVAECCRSVW
jgi:carbamoyl-phosphate synthase large subunit